MVIIIIVVIITEIVIIIISIQLKLIIIRTLTFTTLITIWYIFLLQIIWLKDLVRFFHRSILSLVLCFYLKSCVSFLFFCITFTEILIQWLTILLINLKTFFHFLGVSLPTVKTHFYNNKFNERIWLFVWLFSILSFHLLPHSSFIKESSTSMFLFEFFKLLVF